MVELSKSDRKAAREIIEKGLQQEFEKCLTRTSKILEAWITGKKNNSDSYYALYKHIQEFDNHLSARYDDMKGSTYLFIIAGQISDGIVNKDELQKLSPEASELVQRILNLGDK